MGLVLMEDGGSWRQWLVRMERERRSVTAQREGKKIWGKKTLMWRLVRGNILGFLGMFKDSHVWLQITPENQMPRESGFSPLNPSQQECDFL